MNDELSDLEHVRQRPEMYVGSTEFWGFVNYVVSAYRLLIHWGATRIDLQAGEGLTLSSDGSLPSDLDAANPFESISKNFKHIDVDAFIVNALSKRFTIFDGAAVYSYARGIRTLNPSHTKPRKGLTLLLIPDDQIFSVTHLQPAIVKSYLHRMSYLYPHIRFSFMVNDDTFVYSSPGGIQQMFAGISGPYQLLHEPISVSGKDGEFEMELVFAFHSWSEQVTWTFANAGRVADGGTHDIGLRAALDDFAKTVIADDAVRNRPGYLAIMSFTHPNVQFEGCIKAKIGNSELEHTTHQLVKTLLSTVDMASLTHLRNMSRFKIADFW